MSGASNRRRQLTGQPADTTLGRMSRRLFHFLLAVAVAFVFTGRMEAAANHCRNLAEAMRMSADLSDMAAMPGMAACHGVEPTGAEHTDAGHTGGERKVPGPASEPCDCLALLMADCPVIGAAQASARIEPFRWDRTGPDTFASLERVPEAPPPRG